MQPTTTTIPTTRTLPGTTRCRRAGAAALLALLVAAGAACSDDAGTNDAAASDAGVEHSATSDHSDATLDDTGDDAAGEVVITATDYAFEGVPESVPAGTRLRIDNTSSAELHEIVVFRLPEAEERSFEELMSLDQGAFTAAMGGPPVAVLVQPPGGEPVDALGDGTLHEPGRHVLICSIPVGADPHEYMEAAAASNGGPVTGVAGGPPHLVMGMAAELTVE